MGGGGVGRAGGWRIIISWPPVSSPVKHTSFSSSKNKFVTLAHDTTAKLMYQTNPLGVEIFSLTLSFVSSIPE